MGFVYSLRDFSGKRFISTVFIIIIIIYSHPYSFQRVEVMRICPFIGRLMPYVRGILKTLIQTRLGVDQDHHDQAHPRENHLGIADPPRLSIKSWIRKKVIINTVSANIFVYR